MADEPTILILKHLRSISADIAEIKRVQGEHGKVFDRHTETLREHTQVLDGLLNIMGAMRSRMSASSNIEA